MTILRAKRVRRLARVGHGLVRGGRGALRAGLLVLMVAGCGSDRPGLSESSGGTGVGGGSGCGIPREGCPCQVEGQEIDCGSVAEEHDDYVTCSMGTRTCIDGEWSECVGSRITVKANAPLRDGKLRPLSLGAPAECPEDVDSCDPYCQYTVDNPGGLDPGTKFEDSPDGLTLSGDICSSLTLTASEELLTVTAFSPLEVEPSKSVAFTLTANPPGCATEPFETSWNIDEYDRALISGTNNQDGVLVLAAPIAGPIEVTAYALGMSASVDVAVKVNVWETPDNGGEAYPNFPPEWWQEGSFGSWDEPEFGTIASQVQILYPYQDTYFPLGLLPPVIQYWFTTSTPLEGAGVARVSLRWPTNSSSDPATPNYSDFNYSLVVAERNAESYWAGDEQLNHIDPQIVIPPEAWQYFEQSARGDDADILVQRRPRVAGTDPIELERRRRIHFVDGQLKGTVYYASYSSPQGSNTGAILSIAPGAASPTLAVQPLYNGTPKCTVCHTVNVDGTRLITNTLSGPNVDRFNQSRRYDLTTPGPSPTVLNSYAEEFPEPVGWTIGEYEANQAGDRFTYGASWQDGQLYMTHGGRISGSVGVGDPNFRAPPDYSYLRDVDDPSEIIAVTGWPTNVLAVTPRFSPDGTRLAFGFWGGSSLPTTPSGGLNSASSGRRLTVVDFTCDSPPCDSASTGFRVQNARNVTPGVTHRVAWPSFVPDGSAVLYQRQYRTSKSRTEDPSGVIAAPPWAGSWPGYSPSHINTFVGALAEIWMSDVPANNSTAATPTRLSALNGYDELGASYLPEDTRPISPPATAYHRNAGTTFGITQPDWCSNTGTATNVIDNRLNYLPSVNPTEAGGFSWVVFTSRRMYGNIAYNNPWDAKHDQWCSSESAPTKKLWVSAIDSDFSPGDDPSHPAFYLPGQELMAGNSNAYWVNAPCIDVGGSCTTDDDCCGGSGSSPTTQCNVTSTATVPPVRECRTITACASEGNACATSDDCCLGLVCPAGGGTCDDPDVNEGAPTFEREYVAECPEGTQVEWRHFEWQATIPDGTRIEFAVQTRATSSDPYLPSPAALVATADATTPMGVWYHGSTLVGDVLWMSTPPQRSQEYLRVSMTFYRDDSGVFAPTLHAWRQMYSCLPAE